MKIADNDCKVEQSGWSRISSHPAGWTDGIVITTLGIVSVYAQGDEKSSHATRLDFVWNGRCHSRTYNGKRYSSRAIKTLARKFAEEIAQKASHD